ncbi:helix-turn-helix domain-containing protein [Shewanella corallii]|uniref:Helix-turn-helix domain-containing protein n=1 Tax=Shewanella corallii TaxID=560080 RepID=A0ABT0NCC5_9GAMM|nr:helix-turn-helix domain-containing protein [Shewanella corallii]MCL2916020.1 helix-turn-helix domain-containing protein [Shewanella corallii]
MNFFLSDGYHKKAEDAGSTNQQFSYWQDIVCNEFVQLDCENLSSQDTQVFNGELRGGAALSTMKFAEVIASPQKVTRSKRQIARATEEDFLISFQLSAQCKIRQNGRETILVPGTFALYDSTQPYTLSFNEHFHQMVIQMPKAVLGQHLANAEQYTAIKMCGRAGLGAVLTNFVLSLAKEIEQLNHSSDELSDKVLHMMAMAFSSSVMLEQVNNNSVIKESLKQRIYRYIELNLCNPDISNQTIADAQGISVRYLNKLFSEETESVHALILEKRLIKSLAIMQNPAYSGHSIEKIAFSVGFSSSAHFSRSFKKRFGFSPSEAR